MPIFKLEKTKVNVWIWLDERKGFNEWPKINGMNAHWTYKENRGWLIERGIMAFHWSILLKKNVGKMECPMGNSQEFPSRPWGASEEKPQQKPCEKKDAKNYLHYTSYKVISGYATSGDVISVHFRWCHDPHDPPQLRAWFNMIYYLCLPAQSPNTDNYMYHYILLFIYIACTLITFVF